MEQKNLGIKISPMRAGGEKGKIFIKVKLSSYTRVWYIMLAAYNGTLLRIELFNETMLSFFHNIVSCCFFQAD